MANEEKGLLQRIAEHKDQTHEGLLAAAFSDQEIAQGFPLADAFEFLLFFRVPSDAVFRRGLSREAQELARRYGLGVAGEYNFYCYTNSGWCSVAKFSKDTIELRREPFKLEHPDPVAYENQHKDDAPLVAGTPADQERFLIEAIRLIYERPGQQMPLDPEKEILRQLFEWAKP